MWYRFQQTVVLIACLFIGWALWYGIKTDCPNTEGYVSCADKIRKD